MSDTSEGLSDLNFGFEPQKEYSPARVAETVIWPLVNLYYRDDWRYRAQLGYALMVQKRGSEDGEQIDVTMRVNAELSSLSEIKRQAPIISVVELSVEHLVTDVRRNFILDRVRGVLNEEGGNDTILHCQDGAFDTSLIETADELSDAEKDELFEDLSFKVGTVYFFDSLGAFMLDRCQSVQDLEGHEIVISTDEDANADLETRQRLFHKDLELLESGIYILNPTAAIERALQVVREHPLNS